MCGIAGFLQLEGDQEHYGEFVKYFSQVQNRISQRGPDAHGLWGESFAGQVRCVKGKLENPLEYLANHHEFFDDFNPRLVLVNFRGIPTTEYMRPDAKPDQLIQPYHDGNMNVIVTHNGQLSNDVKLANELKLEPIMEGGSDIDSYLFVKMMNKDLTTYTWVEFLRMMCSVDGSAALVAYHRATRQLFFSRDFRGIHFSLWQKGTDKYLAWSSEPESLEYGPRENISIFEMPPYSMWHIDLNRYQVSFGGGITDNIRKISYDDSTNKYRSDHNKASAAVVLSGGLDSTVCATLACQFYEEVHLIHFCYGARAEASEYQAVGEIYWFLKNRFEDECKVVLKYIDLGFIKDLGGSTLTDHSLDIAQGEEGVETDHEWVPARNMAMIGLAASYCDRHDLGAIILGLNMEEGSVFSDNSVEFYRACEKALNLGTHARPKLVMPVGNMMKHHIVKEGLDIDAPFHLSWSCYEGKEERCGQCGPCVMRQRAFAMNGARDPAFYTKRDLEAEKIFIMKAEEHGE